MKKNILKFCAGIYLAAVIGIAYADIPVNKNEDNIAIDGYDTVAYFTLGKAVKGNSQHEHVWQDARWQFLSARHLELFAADPERYAPQFGGFCAGAMTRGIEVKADPEAWTIVDGRLYMKVNMQSRDSWREDAEENIRKANKKWKAETGE